MKVTVAPFLTGCFVLLGAFVGFKLANKGRKYDILYKERFNSNQRVMGLLFKLRKSLSKLYSPLKIMKYGEESLDSSNPSKALEGLSEVLELMDDLGESLVLLEPRVREDLTKLIAECQRLSVHTKMLIIRLDSIHLEQDDINRYENMASEMAQKVASLYTSASKLINDSYLSLKLPGSKPVFTSINQ